MAVAGIDLEALIAQMSALRTVVKSIADYGANGIEYKRKEIIRLREAGEPDPNTTDYTVEKLLTHQGNCIEAVKKQMKELEVIFTDVQRKLIDKRGKWCR